METNKFVLKPDNILYYVYKNFNKNEFSVSKGIDLKYGKLFTIMGYNDILGYRIQFPHNVKFEIGKDFIKTWRGRESKNGDIDTILLQSDITVYTVNKDTQVITVVNSIIDEYMSL